MRKSLMVGAGFLVPMLASSLLAETGRHAIGIASGTEAFLVDNASAMSSATLFAGDSVQTINTICRVNMKNGSEVKLAPHSAAQLYEDRVVLQRGRAETTLGAGAKIETTDFLVKTGSKQTHANLELVGDSMTVAVLSGQAEVSNLHGVILSRMTAGSSLNFVNVAGEQERTAGSSQSASLIRLVGILDVEDQHYLIRDRFGNSVTELIGDLPAKMVNELTMVYGTVESQRSDIPHVDRVVRVIRINRSDMAGGWPCLPDGAGGPAKRISLKGALTKDGAHYFVSDDRHGTFEVIGDLEEKMVGKPVELTGFVLPNRRGFSPADQLVYIERRKFIAAESPCVGVMATGVMVTAMVLATLDSGGGPAVHPVSF